jgi:hypothetical protein
MRIIGSTVRSLTVTLLPVIAGAAACSVINSYADVKQTPADASMESGRAEAGDDSSADSGGIQDAGASDRGVIVVSGNIRDEAGTPGEGVLTALDPATGKELPNAREAVNAPVVLYDGNRDLWLVIESDSLFPGAGDGAKFYTRTLDPVTGKWTTLQSLQVPAPVFNQAVVLNQRIAYLAPVKGGALGAEELVTIDTEDPTNLSAPAEMALPTPPIGMIGTRAVQSIGGVVDLLVQETCPADAGQVVDEDGGEAGAAGGTCSSSCLAIQHVVSPAPPAPPTPTLYEHLGPYCGPPAYGSFLSGGPVDVIMWSLKNGPNTPGPTSIHEFVPQNLTQSCPIPVSIPDGFFHPLAFAECQQQALVVETNEDLNLYAIPLSAANGTPARFTLGRSGQGVYFEPFTSTVLAPFSQGPGVILQALTLSGDMANPKLAMRSNWNPPPELAPQILAIRNLVPPHCP